MRFWDTSTLVPLFLAEASTPTARHVLREDPAVLAWWGSRVECRSALARLVREGKIDAAAEAKALADLGTLFAPVSEVQPTEEVRNQAERCLGLYPLRAADALQLAAALVWASGSPHGKEFVSLDTRLRDAAGTEGFTVLPENWPPA